MKNLKKVLALVVALTMVLGTVGFAFTDVTEENEVYTAVQTLSSLEILKGYEDGTFGPEKDITRSEFAAVVIRALGLESSANGAKGATQFADVPADHWASGYINLAAGQGIINGYPDGNFGPNDNVTYEQAIKMLVVALGYEPMAAQKGGYPTGYLVVANTYGMTKGVSAPADNAPANRGVVAQLTYNALDIPVMKQVGFGSEVTFGIYDGESYSPYTSLLTGLDVAKLEGVVVATPAIGGTSAINMVDYAINEANDSKYWEEVVDKYTSTDYTTEIEVAEGVNAAAYFGVASIIYVKEYRSGKWEIIAIMAGEDSASVALDKSDIETLADGTLKYYETETATKTTNIKLADPVTVIVNNVTRDIDYVNGKNVSDDAEIVVYENTGDSKYDMIIVKDYEYGTVDEVEVDKDRFSLNEVTGKFTFDFEDDDVSISITNKDGEAITLADFAEDDVIAYILDGNKKTIGYDWIEIINLGQNVVTGTVTEVNSNTDTVYVDGVEYEVASGLTTPQVNEEGNFFLTKTNKIFSFELDASVASNYAYILDAGITSQAFTTGWQFKLLTKDGSITIYDVKDTFTVNGKSYKSEDTAIGGLEALKGADHKELVTDRIITYKLDANNKIREINSVAVLASVGTQAVGSDAAVLEEYNENSMAIDGKVIAEDAVIFNLVGDEEDDAFVTTISTLVHEGEYAGYLVQNKDYEYDAFVVTDGKGAIDLAQDIAVVDSVNTITVNDDDAWKVRYYVSGEDTLKEVTITADTDPEYTTDGIATVADNLVKGDVILLADDGNGIATSIAVVAKVGANNYTAQFVSDDDDIEFVTGYIADINKTSNGTNITTGNNGRLLTVKGSANAYTYNKRTAKNISIVVGDWQASDDFDILAEDGSVANYFFAVVENGIVSDIITHSVRGAVKNN